MDKSESASWIYGRCTQDWLATRCPDDINDVNTNLLTSPQSVSLRLRVRVYAGKRAPSRITGPKENPS